MIAGEVVDILVNEELNVGTYTTQWNASAVASGVYFYRMQARLSSSSVGEQAGDFMQTKKFVLLK
ncbi:MAG: hypothetical protein O7D34_11130 [Ignavibacteria bacterium]|nr:hypothetical protein [Ignavibacteria bacterium]